MTQRIHVYYHAKYDSLVDWNYRMLSMEIACEKTAQDYLDAFAENWPEDRIVAWEVLEVNDEYVRFPSQKMIEDSVTRLLYGEQKKPAVPVESHCYAPIDHERCWKAVEDLCTSYR